jgi:hypothetical protein
VLTRPRGNALKQRLTGGGGELPDGKGAATGGGEGNRWECAGSGGEACWSRPLHLRWGCGWNGRFLCFTSVMVVGGGSGGVGASPGTGGRYSRLGHVLP